MKELIVGIIGAGRIGRVHAKGITGNIPEVTIKTIADVFMNEETKLWAKSLGIKIQQPIIGRL